MKQEAGSKRQEAGSRKHERFVRIEVGV